MNKMTSEPKDFSLAYSPVTDYLSKLSSWRSCWKYAPNGTFRSERLTVLIYLTS